MFVSELLVPLRQEIPSKKYIRTTGSLQARIAEQYMSQIYLRPWIDKHEQLMSQKYWFRLDEKRRTIYVSEHLHLYSPLAE